MSETPSTLDRIVDRCGRLYSLPVVAMRVLELTTSPTVNVKALKDCIENDPALTSKVLRVVNSSLFGLSREVTNLNQALALLGITPLKLLVLGFSLPDELFLGINGDILRRYWHRTLIKAVAAREISHRVLPKAGDESFIAGLLQDIGALVLLQELGEKYSRFLDCALLKAGNLAEAERKSLGYDHVTLSARLLERWKLPDLLVKSVEAGQSHERIESLAAEDRALPQILLLADLLASVLAENRTDLLAVLMDRGQQYFGITQVQLRSLVNLLQENVDHLAEVLQLGLPQHEDYQTILVNAHAMLSAVAADAAGQLLRSGAGGIEPDQELLNEIRRLADEVARPSQYVGRKSVPFVPAEPLTWPAGESVVKSSGGSKAVEAAPRSTPCQMTPDWPNGFDPGLVGRVATAVAACRRTRSSLSLLLVEIDQYDELLITCGPEATEKLVREVGAACRWIDHEGAVVFQSREVQFAVILPDCERRQAVDLSNDLLARLRRPMRWSKTAERR